MTVPAMLRLAVTALCLVLTLPPAIASEPSTALASLAPTLNNGRKWRIGYYEGGQYPDYEVVLKATLRGLADLGWMQPLTFPDQGFPAGGFWRWLAANAVSDHIEFVADAYYAAGNFDSAKRGPVREALIERLSRRDDIDLMFALGTWAGQDLATDAHKVPTVVMSTSDPVRSGIVKSAEDSGLDHVHAKVEPERYARQVELFHDIIGFKTLGIVHEDTPEGRTFAAVEEIEQVAHQRGFRIERCLARFSDVSQEEAEKAVTACYADVAGRADAVYLTVHRGLNAKSLPAAMAAINRAGLPSFSMLGESEVARGVLMSVAQSNYVYVGRFHAETVARIFNGTAPRRLPQIWLAPAKIALNLKTAETIGYDPPVDILMACDEIYQEITPR